MAAVGTGSGPSFWMLALAIGAFLLFMHGYGVRERRGLFVLLNCFEWTFASKAAFRTNRLCSFGSESPSPLPKTLYFILYQQRMQYFIELDSLLNNPFF